MSDGTDAEAGEGIGSGPTGASAGGLTWAGEVAPRSEGGFVWCLAPQHPRWSGAVSGRAASEEEGQRVARTLAQRCTSVGQAALAASDVAVCQVATVFPDEPAGGAAALQRLSVSAVPDSVDARWTLLERRALDWQTRGGRQTFVASDATSDESSWRLRELFGCMGALGEQVTLACAAARDLSGAKALTDSPEAELVRRAWAEHTIHWIMAAGHMLLNVVGRTVALDPAVHPHLRTNEDAESEKGRGKALGTVFPSESDAHEDWPTFSKEHANYL